MKIYRTDFWPTGVFGKLSSDDGKYVWCTLEHAYLDNSLEIQTYYAKVPPGVYNCVRGWHQLAHMAQAFETFEITNVPGHTNILFHSGNVNADSAGCVLLGLKNIDNKEILESRIAFKEFMDSMVGVDSFELEII